VQTSFFWLIIMGGMQFQTEHHLFPQIPFYRLPDSVPIITEELAKLNKKLIYGPVI
jgi:fatty acid desaturase